MFVFAFPHSLCCIPAKLLCGSRPRLLVWRDGSVCGSLCSCVWLCVVVWVFVTVWMCVPTLKEVCAATTQHSRQTRTQGMFVCCEISVFIYSKVKATQHKQYVA